MLYGVDRSKFRGHAPDRRCGHGSGSIRKFPLVLAGNCNANVGTFAGLDDADAGIVWFDAQHRAD